MRPRLLAFRVVVIVFNGIIGPYAFANLTLAQRYAIFITLLAVHMLGEKIDPMRGMTVVLRLVGVVIALDPAATPLQIAHLAAILGAMSGALNHVLLRKTGGTERSIVLRLYPMIAQTLFLARFVPFHFQPMQLADLAVSAFKGTTLVVGSILIIAPRPRHHHRPHAIFTDRPGHPDEHRLV